MRTLITFALVSAGFASAVQAQVNPARLDYSVGIRAEVDDNVNLDPENAVDDILIAPFLGFSLTRPGTKVDANIEGYLEYVDYQDGTFDSEVRSTLDADVLWRVIDQRFHWSFENARSRNPINILLQETPDNLQETNAFSTGPDALFRLSSADQLVLSARYTNFQASEGDLTDSEGSSFRVLWGRNISETRTFGAFVQTSTTDFDELTLITPDFDRRQIALTYEDRRNISGANDRFAVELGYSDVSFDGVDRSDLDSPTARITWERTQPGGESFRITAAREVGSIFDDTAAFAGANNASLIQQSAVSPDPFTRNLLQADWNKPLSDRIVLRMDATYDQQDFDQAFLDQDRIQLGAQLSVRLRPLWSLAARADWVEQEFSDRNQDDERLNGSIMLQYRRTRNLLFELEGRYQGQDSTIPLRGFNNRVIMARITFVRG